MRGRGRSRVVRRASGLADPGATGDPGARRVGAAGRALFAAVLLVTGVVGAPAALAAPPAVTGRGGEPAPSPKACVHNNRSMQRPTAAELEQVPWPRQMLQYQQAWTYARGDGVTVAVVDSGVDARHEQLAGHVVTGLDVTSGKVRRGGASDCSGHGTAVAGIIAAQPMGGRGMSGIAPGATILPVRETWGIDSNGQSVTAPAETLLTAMRAAVGSGARIVNVSITVPDPALTDAQRQAFNAVAQLASDRNVLIVTASGNKSQYTQLGDQPFATYPARLALWYPNVIAVSGVTSDGRVDSDAVVGSFVTVAAPDRGFLSTLEHGGLIAVNGTSYAAPLVSGLAALLLSRFPGSSPADLRARIQATADHPSTDLPDLSVGYGVIDPPAALTAVLAPSATPRPVPSTAPPLGVVTDPEAGRKRAALGAGAVALVLAGLLGFGAEVLRRGRRRGWRPGVRSVPETTAGGGGRSPDGLSSPALRPPAGAPSGSAGRPGG